MQSLNCKKIENIVLPYFCFAVFLVGMRLKAQQVASDNILAKWTAVSGPRPTSSVDLGHLVVKVKIISWLYLCGTHINIL